MEGDNVLPYSALLAVVIPGFVGLGLLAFRRNVTDHAGWIATAATLISVFLMLNMATDVLDNYNQDQSPLLFEYSWIKPINVSFGFIVDVVNLPLGLIVALVSTLTCFYSIQYMAGEKDLPAYYASLLLFMMGMMGVMLSNNLIQFYLFWELMLIPSYLLIALWGTSENRLRIGFKYFIFTHVGALSMLLGILAIYSYTGTFDLVSLPQLIHLIPPEMVNVIFVLLGFGFFVKMAVFPVHTWLPDAHSDNGFHFIHIAPADLLGYGGDKYRTENGEHQPHCRSGYEESNSIKSHRFPGMKDTQEQDFGSLAHKITYRHNPHHGHGVFQSAFRFRIKTRSY